MDYSKHYNLLISRAKSRILESYTELHHIVPRCMGGSDNESNLVHLTPEEHYLAHQLLLRMYPTNIGLIKAANMMTAGRTSNKLYGWLRKRMAIAMSESQTGRNNSQYGKRWIHNVELKVSKKINKKDALPNGWNEGRVCNWNKKEKPRKQSKSEMYSARKEAAKEMANELFDKFKESEYNSICEFAAANGTTQPRLCMLWKKYVDEYRICRQQGKAFKK